MGRMIPIWASQSISSASNLYCDSNQESVIHLIVDNLPCLFSHHYGDGTSAAIRIASAYASYDFTSVIWNFNKKDLSSLHDAFDDSGRLIISEVRTVSGIGQTAGTSWSI